MPHAKAEEEVVYPAIRDAGDDEGFVEQLYDEQAAAEKTLLSILRGDPDDMTYDMKVKMLQKAIQSHVREEETIMVQQAVDAGLDLVALGRDFDRRKQELKPVFERQLSEFRK
jgi:hemerythrin superfamily protein